MHHRRKKLTRKDLASAKKDIRAILLALLDQGWDISRTGAGHFRVTSPAGDGWTVPNSPSDPRALLNARTSLRKLGAQL